MELASLRKGYPRLALASRSMCLPLGILWPLCWHSSRARTTAKSSALKTDCRQPGRGSLTPLLDVLLASSTPQAVNLGEELDGPSLSGLTRSVFGELEVEHFTKLLWPHSRELHSFKKLG
eukprot:385177-Amphidinium_carterae.1